MLQPLNTYDSLVFANYSEEKKAKTEDAILVR
jgi:hypothetical protein